MIASRCLAKPRPRSHEAFVAHLVEKIIEARVGRRQIGFGLEGEVANPLTIKVATPKTPFVEVEPDDLLLSAKSDEAVATGKLTPLQEPKLVAIVRNDGQSASHLHFDVAALFGGPIDHERLCGSVD